MQSAPVIAGDTREILRKYKTRKLAPEQYTVPPLRWSILSCLSVQAQIAEELEEMKRGGAEDALWRISQAAYRLSGGKKQVTQADFDATWKRAEDLEERGEVRKA